MKQKLIAIVLGLAFVWESASQSNIAFSHLNTSNGLSYLGVADMCTDQRGNLWIATGNGLNVFNGKEVERYFATEYPQLQNSNITQVACDTNNRIWVMSAGGHITIIDEKRKFHGVKLLNKDQFIGTRKIVESKPGNLKLYTSVGHFELKPDTYLPAYDSLTMEQFVKLPITGFDTLQKKRFTQIFSYDENQYLYITEETFYRVNYATNRVEKKYLIPHCTALTKLHDQSLLYFDREEAQVKAIDLETEAITYPFRGIRDQFGREIKATFTFGNRINDGTIILSTTNAGIYIYNLREDRVYSHTHHFADASTISSDNTGVIEVNSFGWVFVDCNPDGISYFNSQAVISNQSVFVDKQGNGYDGLIFGIASTDNSTYYLGTPDGLIEWNRDANTTHFLEFKDANGQSLTDDQQFTSILIDPYDHIWATTFTKGVIVFNRERKLLRHIDQTGQPGYTIKLERVARLSMGPDGYVWACGKNGICRIDPVTFKVDNFKDQPLAKFDSTYCVPLLFADKSNLYFATSNKGVFHYHLETGEMQQFSTREGLIYNGIYDLGIDSNRNVYVATPHGLSILYPNGKIKNLKQKDGLLMDRAEGLLLDSHNRMWIGNDIGLARFDPADSSLVTYDERYGLSIYGFRVGAYFKMPNGEFMFGTPKGIQYFHPDSLSRLKISFPTLIHKIESKDVVANISGSETFSLPSSNRQVTFYFNSVDFSPHVRTYYEYQLTGIDDRWIKLVDQNAVRYNALPSGQYVFKVRVSNDNRNWQDAANEVTIRIAKPFYQEWWFRIAGLLLLGGMGWIAYRRLRQKQLQQREQLETESVVNYFASQINQHKDREAMLWDVAKNCISKLNLEECVIYLLDSVRKVLVQKAAYGPKNPKEYTIAQPIEIPLGQGITGYVAQSKKPEIVNNTEKDPRYIVDDDRRLSEMAVPIVVDNEAIGVIDSEHPRRNFFTQKHLSLMTTISILTANQIQRIQAEEEKQKAEIEILQNKQKATESRLQSLRLQMNPHFLFNALNSIQQMILANEEMVATRYLSRFSKLLRSILIHSDKEMISLKEELDILNLYVELESVRFKEAFSYEIACDVDIDTEEVKIPTLLIQPFVENAIWHGLMHKEGMRHLRIAFSEEGEFVHCTIEDNGIGRQKAKEMKISTGQDKKHQSKGIEVSLERLKAMQKNGGQPGSMEIHDLKDPQGHPAGTRVEIRLPILN